MHLSTLSSVSGSQRKFLLTSCYKLFIFTQVEGVEDIELTHPHTVETEHTVSIAMLQLPIKTRATYSWGGNKKTNELGFMEGDVIEILKVVNDSLYFGESQRTKLRGFFPAKYVACNVPNENQTSPSAPSTPVSANSSKNNSFNSLFTLKKKDKSSSSTLNTDILNSSFQEKNLSVVASPSSPKNSEQKQAKKFTSSYVQQLLDASTLSTETGSSSAFGHSDFSATSAGSYMRHKEREEYESKLQSMAHSTHTSIATRKALDEIIEKNEKRKQPKLLRDLLGSRNDTGPSFDDRIYLMSVEKMSQMELDEGLPYGYQSFPSKRFAEPISDMKRTRTVSGHERAKRAKRILDEEPELILKPQETISHVNFEETDTSSRSCSYSLDSEGLEKVDHFMSQQEHNPFDTPQKFTIDTILRKFKTELEVSRAIYTYLTQSFKLIKRKDEKVSTKRMFGSEKISEIMHTCLCTPHQLAWLFYIMADTAGLEVEIVLGYLKHPFALNDVVTNSKKRLIINHSWISIKIDGAYRFIDVILGNPTNDFSVNYPEIWDNNMTWRFYFLARPFHLIHTHSPRYIDQQHIVPPIDVVAQLSLPPLYPSAIASGVSWYKYNTSMMHLRDYELYDFALEIPPDYLVHGKFKPYDSAFECVNSFVQVYQKNDVRIAHFQGIMSKGCPAGFVYVVGKNEYSKKWNLLLSIPCFHQGKWKPLEWMKRVPGLNGVDVYVKEPKINNLKCGEQLFDIKVHGKSDWIREVQQFYDGSLKLGLFPPNKQIIELNVTNNQFTGEINLNKAGYWRLGVLDVKFMRWKVIAEWSVA